MGKGDGSASAAGRRPGKRKKISPDYYRRWTAGQRLTIQTSFIKMFIVTSVLAAWVVGGQEQEQGFLLQATWIKITP